ncbi:MAG: DUF4424 family protein [Terracidiphilus sp.]
MKRFISTVGLAILCLAPQIYADDGAASIAAGGIVVMGKESRIVMAKESLWISVGKVKVEYEFRNDSDQDITTEVAFPIPDYVLDPQMPPPNVVGFDDFKLWINGAPTRFQIESRAFVQKKEITALLKLEHIDIPTFGHGNWESPSKDITRLSQLEKKKLIVAGAIDEDARPIWAVRKKYHWTQVFPAHGIVKIRHEYSPIGGDENSISYGLGSSPNKQSEQEIMSMCPDEKLLPKLKRLAMSSEKDAWYEYVDFILTSANTWKTPIEDFTLTVERTRMKDSTPSLVSFCWDGPVKKIDEDHFVARLTNFIPSRELRVGYFIEQKRPKY